MDADALLRRVLGGTCSFARTAATEVHDLDGVMAAVVPACPERSVLNSVCYAETGRLAAALDRLAALYDEAGVHAWTVWVPSQDHEAANLLERAGHVLDASPEAMAVGLGSAGRPQLELDWTRDGDLGAVAELNDLAYGYDGSFARAFAARSEHPFALYVARVDGRPASCCATEDLDGDCHVTLVATVPEARGRGLAAALLAHALADAREGGLATSSLIATKAGRGVYERLGYRGVGAIEMWERRRG